MSHRAIGFKTRGKLTLTLMSFLFLQATCLFAASPPLRLRLKAERHTVAVGGTVRLTLEFQDRYYKPVANDRQRIVTLEQAPVKGRAGRGKISPQRVTVEGGVSSFSEIRFEGLEPGRVLIRALSEGLTPAQTLLSVVPRQRSWLGELWDTSVYAQEPIALEIFPDEFGELPANGKTPAEFFVILVADPEPGQKVRVRFQASPGKLRYQGEEQPVFIETLDLENFQTKEISLLSSTPGTVRVSARALPDGPSVEVEVKFVPPKPDAITFEFDSPEIPSNLTEVPVTVKLVDDAKFPLNVLKTIYRIALSCSNDPEAVQFTPPIVALGPDQAVARATLEFNRFPGLEVQLLAKDEAGKLGPGQQTLRLQRLIHGLQVSGRKAVHRRSQGNQLTLHLVDEKGDHQKADQRRTIFLQAERGKLEPKTVEIPKGEEHAEVEYQAPDTVGMDTVRIESTGLEAGVLEIRVVTAITVLLFFAGLGGLFGGVTRQVYKTGVRRILPRWVKGYLQLGLLGNALFSLVFGVIFYQAVKLGLVQAIQGLFAGDNYHLEHRSVAFFFGVLGGFAGVVLLDWLLDRFLPGRKGQASPA